MSGAITQSGPVAPGHVPVFIANGTVQDGGAAGDGVVTQIGITNPGGLALGINSGLVSGPYAELGFTVGTNSIGTISMEAFNGASAAGLVFDINGVVYPFPGPGNGNVMGPGSAASGDIVSFNGPTGTLIQDSGISSAAVAALLMRRIVQGPTAAVVGHLATFDTTAGTVIADSEISAAAVAAAIVRPVVQGPTEATSGDLATFDGTTGTIIADSGISVVDGALEQSPTAFFYANQGAKIDRFNDRVLIGADATVQDGNATPSPRTWAGLQAFPDFTYLDSLSQLEVLSTIGGVAGVFAARSSDIAPATWTGCFGIVTLGLNDSTLGQEAWGIYAPAFMADASAFYTAGMETDVCAAAGLTSATSNAYLTVPNHLVTGLSIGAGNEYGLVGPISPASAAISIFPAATHDAIAGTGGLFRKGIVFQADVLVGSNGSVGTATAVEMGKGQQLVWKSDQPNTSIGGVVRSDNVNPLYQTRVIMSTTQFKINGVLADLVTEQTLFAVDPLPGGVAACVPFVSPTETGGQAIFGAQGTDTDIDVRLLTKGTGLVWLGRSALSATVPGNFSATHAIPVRDGSGTIFWMPVSPTLW